MRSRILTIAAAILASTPAIALAQPPPPASPALGEVILLSSSTDPGASTTLRDALAASRANIREETVWFLVELIGQEQPVVSTVVEATGRPREDATPWDCSQLDSSVP